MIETINSLIDFGPFPLSSKSMIDETDFDGIFLVEISDPLYHSNLILSMSSGSAPALRLIPRSMIRNAFSS
ncbi:hypothetical protein VIBNISFn118_1110070 [Vibrio nigripulchritudo SFn118]|nr:hypothetical protein VIBNISFn118_1110070 [Vibrio nigripulchritudo SFn118]